ncbi:uncharacterized protein LOC118561364 isoform X2 [Fundulus heteroclitus]|uniref:uncharacterized protein LOC118561364 isoform X2 n=1 Tax=Fundulus heteroclitus TaxID=8078 RepID=UPI00165AAB20|nr:uncharacterized protein LOC118561364 isoform X2 [Fundulus heteroclitus]
MAASLTASLVFSLLLFTFSVSTGQIIIRAEPGGKVILPCRADENKDVRVVEWRRTDLESDHYLLLYRNSQFDPEGQPPSFRNRVDLLDVENGDVSLVLKNVKTDDTGTYECRVIQRGTNLLDTEPISIINLRVEAGNKGGPEEDERIHSVLTVAIVVELFAVISLTGFVLYRRKGHLCMKPKLPPAETEPMNPEKRTPTEE